MFRTKSCILQQHPADLRVSPQGIHTFVMWLPAELAESHIARHVNTRIASVCCWRRCQCHLCPAVEKANTCICQALSNWCTTCCYSLVFDWEPRQEAKFNKTLRNAGWVQIEMVTWSSSSFVQTNNNLIYGFQESFSGVNNQFSAFLWSFSLSETNNLLLWFSLNHCHWQVTLSLRGSCSAQSSCRQTIPLQEKHNFHSGSTQTCRNTLFNSKNARPNSFTIIWKLRIMCEKKTLHFLQFKCERWKLKTGAYARQSSIIIQFSALLAKPHVPWNGKQSAF